MTLPAKEDILGHECKFVSYVQAIDGSPNDLLIIKERIHCKDGRTIPNLRIRANHQRPFWITKPNLSNGTGARNHKDKKEWESLDQLQKFESSDINLADSIYRVLNRSEPTRRMSLREVCKSPYVYGADVTAPVLLKRHYMESFPQVHGDNSTPFEVAGLDIETDTVRGTEEIIMGSVVLLDRMRLVLSEAFVPKSDHNHDQLQAMARSLLKGKIDFSKVSLEVSWAPTPHEVAYQLIQTLHEWTPDIVEVWNIDFDLPKIVATLERSGYNLGDVFSDPKIPQIFRHFEYKQGATQKVTQSGKSMPLPYFDRWHNVEHAGSFVFLDGMCVFRKLRVAKGMSPYGYGLDGVLKAHGLGGKLKVEGAEGLSGLQWHIFMQKFKKFEYSIYNIWDSYSMLLLDQQTGDLNRQVGLHTGHSEFHRFPSQPRRTWDDMHFFSLKHGLVAGTTAKEMKSPLDDQVIPLTGHIVTLPSHQVDKIGTKCVEEMPDYASYIFTHVADLDIVGTYPTETVVFNLSRETTVTEVIAIEGVDDKTMRSIGVNLTAGHTNSVEICVRVFGAPSMETLLNDFRAERDGTVNTFEDAGWDDGGVGESLEEEFEYSDE